MNKQVLSIEQMRHLEKLGLDTSDASASWYKPDMGTEYMLMFGYLEKEELVVNEESIPAYTLQDVLDKLPRFVTYQYRSYDLIINMEQYTMEYFREADLYTLVKVEFINTNLIDAAYEMLCWCIENGYVNTKN